MFTFSKSHIALCSLTNKDWRTIIPTQVFRTSPLISSPFWSYSKSPSREILSLPSTKVRTRRNAVSLLPYITLPSLFKINAKLELVLRAHHSFTLGETIKFLCVYLKLVESFDHVDLKMHIKF